MSAITRFTIARCPEHGLHGRRDECFICGGAVEQVEVVTRAEYSAALDVIDDYAANDLGLDHDLHAIVERLREGPATVITHGATRAPWSTAREDVLMELAWGRAQAALARELLHAIEAAETVRADWLRHKCREHQNLPRRGFEFDPDDHNKRALHRIGSVVVTEAEARRAEETVNAWTRKQD